MVLSLCPSQAAPMHGIANTRPAARCGGHLPTLALPRAHVPCHSPPRSIPQEVCTSPPAASCSSSAPPSQQLSGCALGELCVTLSSFQLLCSANKCLGLGCVPSSRVLLQPFVGAAPCPRHGGSLQALQRGRAGAVPLGAGTGLGAALATAGGGEGEGPQGHVRDRGLQGPGMQYLV